MESFWLNNFSYFIAPAALSVAFFWFSLNFYTKQNKKLNLIVNDIKTIGYVRKIVLDFDGFFTRNGLDPMGFSLMTHLFYRIPKPIDNPELYSNKHFIEQLDIVRLYRAMYKLIWLFLLIDSSFMATMYVLYGSNFK